MLEVSLFEVGRVVRLERDALSVIKPLRQATMSTPPPTPPEWSWIGSDSVETAVDWGFCEAGGVPTTKFAKCRGCVL